LEQFLITAKTGYMNVKYNMGILHSGWGKPYAKQLIRNSELTLVHKKKSLGR